MTHMSFRSALLSALSLALLAGSPTVSMAQVTVKLNWGQSNPCIFTTDAQGVSLDPQTGALTANGTFDTSSANSSCPSSTPVGTPSFSNALSGDVGATVATGTSATLTWQADADNCDYSGTSYPAGVTSVANWSTSSTSGAACSSSAACNTAHSANITFPADGNYTFGLRCYKNGNTTPATSVVSTVASTQSTACTGVAPAGLTRQLTGAVTQYTTTTSTRNGVDVTRWDQVWGYDNTVGTPSAWPAVNNILQSPRITKNYYLAVAFSVPSTFSGYGDLKETTTGSSGAVSMTISECPGHFNSNVLALPAKCQVNLTAEGGAKLAWTTDTSVTTKCALTPGKTYYLNVITASLSTPTTSTCTTSSCTHTIVNTQTTLTP